MLHEYAVEPELVATWVDRRMGRYFLDKFGLGAPRIISRYPRKHWKKLVWIAGREHSRDEVERKRLQELVKNLSEVMVKRRDAVWNPERKWLDNVLEEHRRASFRAILARGNPVGHSAILVADELERTTPLWNPPRGVTVARKANAIADAVGDMLRAATDIVMVDPYFAPHHQRFLEVLDACLGKCFDRRVASPPRIRIFSSNGDKSGTFEFFKEKCSNHLPGTLPVGQKATIRRLQERRPNGEKLHNRYILTELGGVSFGTGLDREEELERATDDLNLLDRRQYETRWRQYAGEPPEFDQPEDPVTVTGTGRIP